MLSDSEVARLRAQVGVKPETAWFEFLCNRCHGFFKAQSIALLCDRCWSAGALPLNGGEFSGT